jgi:FtsP/CotA-like multicopper oxidase with cupredoxin domain
MAPMPGSRFLLLAALLLIAAALASSLVARERPDPARAPGPIAPGPATPPRKVTAVLPGATVRARVGDVVSLAVESDTVDTAEIVALGVQAPVEPHIPGELLLTADRPGRFAVVLRDAARRVGTLQILPAA